MLRLLKRLAIGYEHHGKDQDTPYLVGGTFVVALLFLGIVTVGSPLVSRFAHTYTSVASVIVAALVDMANSDRALNGAGPLTVNPVLTEAAQAKANDMAARGYFAHFDAAGKGPWDWMKEAGYVYHYAGENLAIQFSETADVEHAWLNSPAHRENLLDPRFTEVGIATAEGLYQGRPTTYVVQFFGTPAPVLALREAPPTSTQSAPSEPEAAAAASGETPAPAPETSSKASETPQKPARGSVAAESTSTDVVVLGLVSDTDAPAQAPTHHASASTSTQPTTTPALLFAAPQKPDLERLVVQAPPSPFKRLQASPLFIPRLLIALLSALAAFGLAGALLRELEHWHVKHSFYAASLSAASVAVAFIAVSVPSQTPILDPHPIAFASDPSAHVAVIIPADGRVYAAGAPVSVRSQTATVASIDLSSLADRAAKSPLIPLLSLIGIVGVIAFVVIYLKQAPARADARTEHLVQQLATLTQNLAQAERIGQFGSFFWDYQDPASSFWSDEMYVLMGLVRRASPPAIDTFVELAAPEDKPQVLETIGKAKTQPGAFAFSFRSIAHDKSTRFLKVEGTTMIRDTGKAWRIHGFAHDISREAEIDRSKSEFVSLASHQLKTPLTAIRWLVEAAQSGAAGPFTPEQRAFIDKIGRSTQNMITIVNDLLNVSRIEMNRLATQIETLDVKALAESVIEEQRHAAETRKISVAFTCGTDVPAVQADRNALRMIVQNLVSNAIKYTPEGGSVSCDISLAGARTQAIYLAVSDTGIGIPKAEQSRVFEKLHRASNAQALAVEGTGLGLYVVKTVIEKAGGAITFDSTEGKGTTFTVTIPLVWKVAPSQGIATLA